MKKIKLLLPLWLVLLYFVGIVYMFQSRMENDDKYTGLIQKARYYAENEVLTDSVSLYKEALLLNPNIGIAVEAGELLLKHEAYAEAKKWYRDELYAKYPNVSQTYDYGIRLYLTQNNYRQAFAVYEECTSREVNTEQIEELMVPVLYTFDLYGSYSDVLPFHNSSGIAAVKYNDRWGYIDADGERVREYVYLSAGMFGDLAAVTNENGEASFIDINGDKRITDKLILAQDPEFGKVVQFLGIEGGVFWAYNGEYWNCYDAQSFKQLFGGYHAVTNVTNGVAAVQNETGKWAVISGTGSEITEYCYDDIRVDDKQVFCRTDSFFVKEGEDWYLLNKEGNRIGEYAFEDACAFYDTTYAAVKREGVWRYIDSEGDELNLGSYEDARSFSNGYAAVKSGGKWGYIDLNGRVVIDYQFEEAKPFNPSGTAFVKVAGESDWRLMRLYKYNHD